MTNAQLAQYQRIVCYLREFLAKPHPLVRTPPLLSMAVATRAPQDPHPAALCAQVGRRGPVCPFVPQSLRRRCLYLSIVRTNPMFNLGAAESGPKRIPTSMLPAARAALSKLVLRFVKVFESLPPTSGRQVGVKAVVLVFPDVMDADAPALIDQVQYQCKVGCGDAPARTRGRLPASLTPAAVHRALPATRARSWSEA